MSRTPEFTTWLSMRSRCKSKVEKNYAGRGIVVCDRWQNSFSNFLADMGNKPTPEYSLDRIDPNGNYEPDNCRWATNLEQSHNKRNNHNLTLGGETLPLTVWSRRLNISTATLIKRLNMGWSENKTLTTPLRGR